VMVELLEGVIQHGTGYAASKLNHPLGGKTGTTNDFTDAWFMGFSPSVTCGVWVGYDEKKTLGNKETGARAALPIWMEFMKTAIAGKKDEQFPAAPVPAPSPAPSDTAAARAVAEKSAAKSADAVPRDAEAH
jgi:penicillin-binding protein 1A